MTHRRLVNALIVACYPTRDRASTYTRAGAGAWGDPTEALAVAQRSRDAYHSRHGTSPITEVPWIWTGAPNGSASSWDPPSVAVGVEIHDVHTGERWFVPATGPDVTPITSRCDRLSPLPVTPAAYHRHQSRKGT